MKRIVHDQVIGLPTTIQLEKELYREKYKFRYIELFKSTISVLVVVIAFAVLVSNFLFPVLRISGGSMSPTLILDDMVLCVKKSNFEVGDVIAFYYNNEILIRRVIATSFDWVTMDEMGNVFVNNELLEEDYIKNKVYGEVDIEFPYQVPVSSYFVLTDQREFSVDSRNSLIGTVSSEDILGKVIFRFWPMERVGIVR